jgi:hypothetical protein
MVEPTAIGRIPPSFFFKAQRFAPYNIGHIDEGTSPFNNNVPKFVKDVVKFTLFWPNTSDV